VRSAGQEQSGRERQDEALHGHGKLVHKIGAAGGKWWRALPCRCGIVRTDVYSTTK
jgi:hypothetical protein